MTLNSVSLGAGSDNVSIDINNLSNADTIDFGSGDTDTLTFTNSGTVTDLDFTNISNLDGVNFANGADTVTLGTEMAQAIEGSNDAINGNGGDDSFTLDFSNIGSFVIDGGEGSETNGDTINLTGNTGSNIGSDTNFGHINAFDNIEELDFTSLTLNVGTDNSDGGTNAEYQLTGDLISNWTDSSNTLKLKLDSDDVNKLEFTDKNGNKYGGDDSDTNTMTSGTYTLSDGGTDVTLIIDIQ